MSALTVEGDHAFIILDVLGRRRIINLTDDGIHIIPVPAPPVPTETPGNIPVLMRVLEMI